MFFKNLISLNYIWLVLVFISLGCGANDFSPGQKEDSNSTENSEANDGNMESADAKSGKSKSKSESKSKSKSDKYGECLELTASDDQNLEYYYEILEDDFEDDVGSDSEELYLSKTKGKSYYCDKEKKSKKGKKEKK
ncbi:MAG: hypothetical protein AB8G05_17605 [Oligoflexales bacterium]